MSTDDKNPIQENQVVKSDNFDINLNLDDVKNVETFHEMSNEISNTNTVPEEKLDLSIDFSTTKSHGQEPENIETAHGTSSETKEQEEVKIKEDTGNDSEGNDEDRLEFEDKKNAEELNKVKDTNENNNVETHNDASNNKNNVKTAPDKSNLENDMKIIEELTGEKKIDNWWLDPKMTDDTNIKTKTEIKNEPQTINLDNLIGVNSTPVVQINVPETKAPEIKTEEIKVVWETKIVPEVLPVVNANPIPAVNQNTNYFQMQPNIATNAVWVNTSEKAILNTSIPHKHSVKKIFEFVSLFLGLWIIVFFVLKTMYPIEFHNIAWDEPIQTWDVMSGEIISWEVLSWDLITWEINNALIELSGLDTESDFNAFQDLESAMTWINSSVTQPDPTEAQKIKLQRYQDEGQKFMNQWTVLGDNVMRKYGLFIYFKALRFLQSIENAQQIDNLSWYFAQFDEYLSRLQNLMDENLQSWIAEDISQQNSDLTTDTGSTDAAAETVSDNTDVTQETTWDQTVPQ